MDQMRLLVALALSLVVFLVWQFFFAPEQPPKNPAQTAQEKNIPKEQAAKETPYVKASEPADSDQTRVSASPARAITVDTPLYRAIISEKGAVFTSLQLKDYRETVQKDSPLKQLLPHEYALKSLSLGFSGKSVPGLSTAVFSTDFSLDELKVGETEQQILFFWESEDGIRVEKTYKFNAGTYVIGLDVTVKNGSGRTIQDSLFVALESSAPDAKRAYGHEGPSAYINNSLEEIKVKDIEDKNTLTGNIKWIALQDRYFISSIMPLKVQEAAAMHLSLNSENVVQSQYIEPEAAIHSGTQHDFKFDVFFGPKSMEILNSVGHDLGKALDFGWFDILAKPCLWLMNKLHSFIPNYGVAIIILTILIKLVLWPLGTKSYKSMNEMKKLQPLMKDIREKYKNDKKKMNEEVMALYRTYKINPMGGCLPMVVQIPVFFAFYRMLYSAIDLRHAPFMGWINDLSAPDRLFHFSFSIPFMEPPYGIPALTIVMGATMILQQKMSPPMGDPTQAKMMMLMPIVFMFIFINFSSGLVLYWLVNNILSIGQQYYIQKKFA